MNEELLKKTLARNIAYYRRMSGQTQSELAEKLCYSDKSVSKWERGDGLPDITVLAALAELYGVSVNDLISDSPAEPQKHPTRVLVTLLSIGLVWLVAVAAYFALRLSSPQRGMLWLAFIYALPVSCILLVVFTSLWWSIPAQAVSVSLLVWSLAVCVHLSATISGIHLIYVVAGVFQVLVILWYILRARRAR